MGALKDAALAANVVRWLEKRGCVVSATVNHGDPMAINIHYTLKNDMKPQPAVRIKDGAVIFPEGSNEDIIFAFLLQQ